MYRPKFLDRPIFNFMMVGSIGYVINMIAYWTLLSLIKTSETTFLGQQFYLPPFVVSSFLAIVSNYEMNRVWTFKGWSRQQQSFLKYLSMASATLVFDMALLFAFVSWLGMTPVVAAGLAIIIVFILRYFIAKRWIWRCNE